MSTVQRYHFDYDTFADHYCSMEPSHVGDWVMYEDHQRKVSVLEYDIASLERELDALYREKAFEDRHSG